MVLPDGRIEVICAGQWLHEERHEIAHALGLADEEVVVRHGMVGGAFGGREDISVQIVLALAALRVGRPVKTVWTREESIIGHHKRHPFTIRAKWGATREGNIVAAQMDLTSDAGAYAYTSTKVLGNALLAAMGPYAIANVDVTARTVYTNNTPSGAFRGFGGPQAHFAAEMQVNKLAEALGMDPVELRMRNLWRDGAILPTRSPLPAGCSAVEVLARAPRPNPAGRRPAQAGSAWPTRSPPQQQSGRSHLLRRRSARPGESRTAWAWPAASRMWVSASASPRAVRHGWSSTARAKSSAPTWAVSAQRWARARIWPSARLPPLRWG